MLVMFAVEVIGLLFPLERKVMKKKTRAAREVLVSPRGLRIETLFYIETRFPVASNSKSTIEFNYF